MIPSPDVSLLTPQQLRVLRLLLDGRTDPEIAARMVVSVDTIKAHIVQIRDRLGVTDRSPRWIAPVARAIGREESRRD